MQGQLHFGVNGKVNSACLLVPFQSQLTSDQLSHCLGINITNHVLHHPFILLRFNSYFRSNRQVKMRKTKQNLPFFGVSDLLKQWHYRIFSVSNYKGIESEEDGTLSLTYYIDSKTRHSSAQEMQWKTAIHDIVCEGIFTVQAVLLSRADHVWCVRPTNWPIKCNIISYEKNCSQA